PGGHVDRWPDLAGDAFGRPRPRIPAGGRLGGGRDGGGGECPGQRHALRLLGVGRRRAQLDAGGLPRRCADVVVHVERARRRLRHRFAAFGGRRLGAGGVVVGGRTAVDTVAGRLGRRHRGRPRRRRRRGTGGRLRRRPPVVDHAGAPVRAAGGVAPGRGGHRPAAGGGRRRRRPGGDPDAAGPRRAAERRTEHR